MLALVAWTLFGGYLLAYAAVANGGKFAATPWEALRASAYEGAPASAGGPSPAGGSSSIVSAGRWLIDHALPFGGLLP